MLIEVLLKVPWFAVPFIKPPPTQVAEIIK
jgi:hypothetical protein